MEAPFKQEEVKQTRPAGKKQSGKRVLNTLRTIAKISPVNLSKQSHLNRPKGSKESNESDTNMIILVLLALFIPPLAVYLYYGEINTQFWISIVLCILGGGLYGSLGYIGFGFASIHALLVIFGIFG